MLLEEIGENDDIVAEEQIPRLVEEKKIKRKRVQRQERMLVRRNSVDIQTASPVKENMCKLLRFGKFLLKYRVLKFRAHKIKVTLPSSTWRSRTSRGMRHFFTPNS